MDKILPPEAHFDFCGMHVDVDFAVRHFEKKQRRGKNGRRQNVAIGFVNRVQNQPVAHQAAVHENINSIAVQPLHFGPRSKTGDGQRCFFFFGIEFRLGDRRAERRGDGWNLYQLFESLSSKELVGAVGQFFSGRGVDDFLRWRGENKLFAGIRERVVRDERCYVTQFG